MQTLVILIAGVLGFFAPGAITALWSHSEDAGDAVIQAGDLSVRMDEGYSWEMKVLAEDSDSADPVKVPDGMEYENPIAHDSGLYGETATGTDENPIPLGGDWTTLDLVFTGSITKIGDNLTADVTIKPVALPGVSMSKVTYTVIVDSGDDTETTLYTPGSDDLSADEDEDGFKVWLPQGVWTQLSLKVTLHLSGDALGIDHQVSTSAPEPIELTHLFDIEVRQVRPS